MIAYNGNRYYFDAAVALMDDELREELRAELAGWSKQVFFDEYCERHLGKFGAEFVID
jgi:hypothetical protein